MDCGELIKGHDVACGVFGKRYYQNIVLVNKEDVSQYNIYTEQQKNRINFNLKPTKTGFLFASNERVQLIGATFKKIVKKNVSYYSHSLVLPILGVSEGIKTLLRDLDDGEYFGAIQFIDGTVEILGFNYGLKAEPYTFDGQNGLGGIQLTLTSDEDERYPPYIYIPKILDAGNTVQEQANIDFNNLFANISEQYTGDFNNDYNSDYYITS